MTSYLKPVGPDMGHPRQRDTDGGMAFGGSTELRTANRFHAGMTVAERVACGRGSAADRQHSEEQNRQHKVWLASPAGRKFLKGQHE